MPTYPSDLTDGQWELITPLLPGAKHGGRPRTVDIRTIINGILYLVRTGCQWRMLPVTFGPWSTVCDYFRKYRKSGLWQQIHDSLRKAVRKKAGRKSTPSAAIVDSQSVKTTEKGGVAATMRAKRLRAANAI